MAIIIRLSTGVSGKMLTLSQRCYIPLRPLYGAGHMEPTFIRKRNEWERDRVRYVNEGYARLKKVLLSDSKIENLEIYSMGNETNKEMCQC
ncbi:hypothetical protein ACJMK2_028542 [Sinanodonta woodiana]|uniref:BHLH domain-containing protein n=1 Tax=Sinanodonta woodiana TaxID=1069815 RepID=A0ABD3X7F3_SINWO